MEYKYWLTVNCVRLPFSYAECNAAYAVRANLIRHLGPAYRIELHGGTAGPTETKVPVAGEFYRGKISGKLRMMTHVHVQPDEYLRKTGYAMVYVEAFGRVRPKSLSLFMARNVLQAGRGVAKPSEPIDRTIIRGDVDCAVKPAEDEDGVSRDALKGAMGRGEAAMQDRVAAPKPVSNDHAGHIEHINGVYWPRRGVWKDKKGARFRVTTRLWYKDEISGTIHVETKGSKEGYAGPVTYSKGPAEFLKQYTWDADQTWDTNWTPKPVAVVHPKTAAHAFAYNGGATVLGESPLFVVRPVVGGASHAADAAKEIPEVKEDPVNLNPICGAVYKNRLSGLKVKVTDWTWNPKPKDDESICGRYHIKGFFEAKPREAWEYRGTLNTFHEKYVQTFVGEGSWSGPRNSAPLDYNQPAVRHLSIRYNDFNARVNANVAKSFMIPRRNEFKDTYTLQQTRGYPANADAEIGFSRRKTKIFPNNWSA